MADTVPDTAEARTGTSLVADLAAVDLILADANRSRPVLRPVKALGPHYRALPVFRPGQPRPSVAGQTVLSGRATLEVCHGAIPIPTTGLPDGKWILATRNEAQHYTGGDGIQRHHTVTKTYILVGVPAGPDPIEQAVLAALTLSGLADIERQLQQDGWLPKPPRSLREGEIGGVQLYEHLLDQRDMLFGGWVTATPGWLTEWLAQNATTIAQVDAGGTVQIRGRRRG